MFTKISYLVYKVLAELSKGPKKKIYLQKKKQLKSQMAVEKYGMLYESLKKVERYQIYHKNYLLFKQHYNISIPAEACGIGDCFSFERIKLKDIKRRWKRKLYSLTECSPYKFLQTRDKKIYQEYVQKHIDKGVVSENCIWTVDRFIQLEKDILKKGYDPTCSVIVIDQDNVVIDGQHRAIILLYHYGEDYEIPIVRVSQKS